MAGEESSRVVSHPCLSESDKLETLNFKVPNSFKKAFKGYAVARGMSMVELLREGFELSKADREK